SEVVAGQQAEISRLAHEAGVRADESRHEIDQLRRADQNMMSGLNQRLYAGIGGVRSEVSDLRLRLVEKSATTSEVDQRLESVEARLDDLAGTQRQTRLHHAQVDLFLDEVRSALPEWPTAAALAALPDRGAHLELAVAELLDGPVDRVRADRRRHIEIVRGVKSEGATGPVFDMSPGRGEWLEELRSAGLSWHAASANPHIVRHCRAIGLHLTEADPLTELSTVERRSVGAITAFRFAERLEYAELARFAALAGMALRPGGVLLVETPWPATGQSDDFLLDPFASRPVHPTLLRFLVEAAGLREVEIIQGANSYCLTARR
ncbi:MAG: hypothetical protein M3443_08850, partial [Actinomycetota bacterium]|nr:hypothetical protein [Actinomycetota bacterium]